jgi:hypothetical protein
LVRCACAWSFPADRRGVKSTQETAQAQSSRSHPSRGPPRSIRPPCVRERTRAGHCSACGLHFSDGPQECRSCPVRGVSGELPLAPVLDERQPCRLKLARGLLLAESSCLVVTVANAGTLHGRPEVACGRRDGPVRCRAVLARRPGAKRQARAPVRKGGLRGVLPPPSAKSAQNSLLSHRGRVRAHHSSPKTENRSVRFAGLLEPTLGLEPRIPSLRVMGRCHHQSPGVTSGHASRPVARTGDDSW